MLNIISFFYFQNIFLGNLYFLVDVKINSDGFKHIYISSCVKFINNLDCPIEIEFLSNGESRKVTLENNEKKNEFSLPLKYLENKTELKFMPITEYLNKKG